MNVITLIISTIKDYYYYYLRNRDLPPTEKSVKSQLKFLDLGLLSLSYDLCEKHQFSSLFATLGKKMGFEGFASL